MVGARAGEKKRSAGHLAEDDPVEFLVGAESRWQMSSRCLHKSGRVEDYEIVIDVRLTQEFEKVGFKVSMLTETIQGEVFFYRLAAAGADLDAVDMGSAARERSDAEAPGIGKSVQDTTVFGVLLNKRAHLSLVKEKAGLLPSDEVDGELESIFQNFYFRVLCSVQESPRLFEPTFLAKERGRFLIDSQRVALCNEQGDDLAFKLLESRMGDLKNEHTRVRVDDQAGDSISFGVDEFGWRWSVWDRTNAGEANTREQSAFSTQVQGSRLHTRSYGRRSNGLGFKSAIPSRLPSDDSTSAINPSGIEAIAPE